MNSRFFSILAVAFSALLITLSFSPVDWWYLAFIGLTPLIWVFSKGRKGFFYGYLFGFFYSVFMVHWLAFNSGEAVWIVTLSMLAAAAVLALNYAFIGWAAALFFRRGFLPALALFPLLWTSVEYLRSFGSLGFPWVALANGQAEHRLFSQLADLGGIWFISFLIVVVNVLLFYFFRELRRGFWKWQPLTAVALIFLLAYAYGGYRWHFLKADGAKAVFRIVQPNFAGDEKWDRENRVRIFSVLDSLSRAPGIDSVDIIIWPESATPVHLRKSRHWSRYAQNLVNETQKILLTGAPDYEKTDDGYESFNSLLLFEPGRGITGKYDKEHLVPLGEYIPLSERFPVLLNLNIGIGNFISGVNDSINYHRFQNLRLAPIICYESIFPHIARKRILQNGAFHLLVTNDSWFGNSWGPYQHAAQARFRAIESRRPLIRSANTGISMAVDIHGEILDSLALNTQGFLDMRVSSSEQKSLYYRFGDWFAKGVLLLFFSGVIWLWRKK
jgi:apolipoprotein N-acyltransferase